MIEEIIIDAAPASATAPEVKMPERFSKKLESRKQAFIEYMEAGKHIDEKAKKKGQQYKSIQVMAKQACGSWLHAPLVDEWLKHLYPDVHAVVSFEGRTNAAKAHRQQVADDAMKLALQDQAEENSY
jgi:hypothetical protein